MALTMVSPADAHPRRQFMRTGPHTEPDTMNALDYFGKGSGRDIELGAAGWILELENQSLANHFHEVDQFQIFLPAAGAMYQRDAIDSLVIQYTDAFTAYGPLIGKDEPFRFFTLRPKENNVYAFMPDEKDPRVQRGHRHDLVTPKPFAGHVVPLPGAVTVTDLIAADDGLRVVSLDAGPGAQLTVEAPESGKIGQFVYVSDGSAAYDGADYPAETLGWQRAEDGDAVLQAGPEGCRVIVFRFPTPGTDEVHAAEAAAAAGSTAG